MDTLRRLKPEVVAGFAQAQVLHEACLHSTGEENQGGLHGEIRLEQSLERKTKRNGISNPWSLHYSEIIRHIKKKPGAGDV